MTYYLIHPPKGEIRLEHKFFLCFAPEFGLKLF